MRKYTILTDEQIEEARKLATQGVSQSALCGIFGVSAPTMHHHLFSDGPLMRRCEFCKDEFPIRGRAKFCDTECGRQANAKAQASREWKASARREAVSDLIDLHRDEFNDILSAQLEKHSPA